MYVDEGVNHWRSYATKNIYEHDLTSVKRTAHYNYIQCFPYSITISNVTLRCPTLTFKLSTSVEFSVRNYTYVPLTRKVKITRVEHRYIDDISMAHFDKDSLSVNDAVKN